MHAYVIFIMFILKLKLNTILNICDQLKYNIEFTMKNYSCFVKHEQFRFQATIM